MTETASFARRLANAASRRRFRLKIRRWPYLPAIAALAYGYLAAPNVCAQAPKPTEYEVEAAYLSHFGGFVQWPARVGSANDPFYVCVLGQDVFGPLLDAALKGETIGGAPMAARRLTGVEESAGCRILFIRTSKDSQLIASLAALGKSNILTVSDLPGFTRRGGMIQFVLDGNRVRFEINLTAAQRAGLTLSSELLKLAVAIRRAP
jgi:hypothetical protein